MGDFPISVVESPDGCCAVVSTAGVSSPTLTVVDVERMMVRQSLEPGNAWLGLAFSPDGRRLYSSAGSDNAVDVFLWKDRKLEKEKRIALGEKLTTSFLAGLAVSADGRRLFIVNPLGLTLSAVDLESGRVERMVTLPAEPYTCLLSKDGKTLLVSLWGGSRILLVDPASLAVQGEVEVGEHPAAMALSRDGASVFVACANTNAVWVVDIASRKGDRADLDRPGAEGAGGEHAQRARAFAGRRHAPRRERRQQHGRGRERRVARIAGEGLSPGRLVSDGDDASPPTASASS